MELNELIQQAWGEHAEKSADVADRLEAHVDLVRDPEGAAGFMRLVNHAVGDHLGDRERAARLCQAAIDRAGEAPGTAPLLQLAVARHLVGDPDGAARAEAKAGDDAVIRVRVDMLVAQGHAHAGSWTQAASLYAKTLAAATALPEGNDAERTVAVVSNNIASELLELDARDEKQDALMANAAEAARTFWRRVGTWVNDERALYLLSLVHTAIGQPAEGRARAEEGLALIADNGEEPVDEAFLHLAHARACRDAGSATEHAASLARAEEKAKGFADDAGLATWFQSELEKAR